MIQTKFNSESANQKPVTRTLMTQMVEFSELALVNVNRLTEWARHNLMHQWLLLAMTKSLTGTNTTLSLHTTPLRRHSFHTWCRRQAFFDCCFPLKVGTVMLHMPSLPAEITLAMEATLRSSSTKLHRSVPTISTLIVPSLLMLRPLRYMS